MVVKKRGLGKGLDALLAGGATEAVSPDEGLQNLPLDFLQPGKYQPRVDMSESSLEDLAASIKAQGLVQPIIVRPIAGGRYEIIAGERRWRASQMAGLESISAVVRDVSDRSTIAMALIENIQRENLNPMEEANSIERLREEFELTHQQAAEAVGKSRASVTNLLRLLNLNEDVKRMLENGDLEMGHARALLALEGDVQTETAKSIVNKGASVREAEQLIRRLQLPKTAAEKEKSQTLPEQEKLLATLKKQLVKKMKQEVDIKHGKMGKGKIVISYASMEELKSLVEKIK